MDLPNHLNQVRAELEDIRIFIAHLESRFSGGQYTHYEATILKEKLDLVGGTIDRHTRR